MSTDLERRLRVTFDEMIPLLIEQIGVVDVVADAPTMRPRRWVGVGALAVAASVVALAFVVGRDDEPSTTGVTDTSAPGTTDVPAWYPILRAAVPVEFEYLALTAVGIDGASFVAINPTTGASMEVSVGTGVGFSCNLVADEQSASFKDPANGCPSAVGSPYTSIEMNPIAKALPHEQLKAATAGVQILRSPEVDLSVLIASAVPNQPFISHIGAVSDDSWEYGAFDGSTDTVVRIVRNVYPRPDHRVVSAPTSYGSLTVFWAVDPSGVAVRVTTTLTAAERVARLQTLSDDVLDALMAQSTAPPVATTSTVVLVEPGRFDAIYGPITLGDGTVMSVRVDSQGGLCTLLADGQVGGCDSFDATGAPAVVLWGNDYGSSLQTVYGVVEVGYTLSVTTGDGSAGTPVVLTTPQQGWSAYAFQQPVNSQTTLVVTDAAGTVVLTRSLCC